MSPCQVVALKRRSASGYPYHRPYRSFFGELGFTVATGPEIEDDYQDFDALNIPVTTRRALTTTLSGLTLPALRTRPRRTTLHHESPAATDSMIAPGRVYRNDYDQTHTPMFHQMEGLIVDTNISFTNLKGTLHDFLRNFFEEDLQIRFRPSYFPFTEPSAEVDVMGKNGTAGSAGLRDGASERAA